MANLAVMKQIEERQVDQEICKFVWSPKMDILAVALVTGDVSLYRLNWQKIWSCSPDKENDVCTSLSWRPDGKVLAVGYSSGALSLLDIESDIPICRSQLEGSVSFLNWIACKKEGDDKGDNSTRQPHSTKEATWAFLTKFPSLSKAFSYNPSSVEEVEDCRKLDDGGSSSLLLGGTDQGVIQIFMNGFLPCATISVNDFLGSTVKILDVCVAGNLSTFSVLTSDPKQDDGVQLVFFSMPLIAVCFKELQVLSDKYSILTGILSYIDETIKQITEAWEGILLEMDTKLNNYASKLPDKESGMSADFLDLLMFGIPSGELELFLLKDLTEKGLKKLGHSIEVSYSNVQRLVLKYLHTVSQSLNFQLAEMIGLFRASEKFAIVGISESRIVEAQRSSSSFWSKGKELQQVIDESMKNLKAFFRWLYVEIIKLSEETTISEELSKVSQQDIRFIAEFLETFDVKETENGKESHKYLERVGQYLKPDSLSQPVDRTRNPWHQFMKENPELTEIPFIISVDESTSLIQEHESLKVKVLEIFRGLRDPLTDKCRFDGLINLGVTAKDLRYTQMLNHDLDCVIGVVAQSSAVGASLLFYTVGDRSGRWGKTECRAAMIATKDPPRRIVDCHFYTNDTLSILLEDATNDSSQSLLQFATNSVVDRPALGHVSLSPEVGVELRDDQLATLPLIDTSTSLRELDNITSSEFCVSGPRKVAAFLFRNRKRIRIYDMEVEEDEDDDENEATSGMSSAGLNTSG